MAAPFWRSPRCSLCFLCLCVASGSRVSETVDIAADVESEAEALEVLEELKATLERRKGASSEQWGGLNFWDADITDGAGQALLTSQEDHSPPQSFDIYLSDPPERRWNEVAEWTLQNDGTGILLKMVFAIGGNQEMLGKIRFLGAQLLKSNSDQQAEIKGFAAAAQEPPEDIATIQALYAILTACTSIVAEGEDGSIVHGRLLDFEGEGVLRRRTFQARWFAQRGDTVPVFTSAQFAGHLGVLTGLGRGFAVAVNQRGRLHGKTFSNWLSGLVGGQNVATVVRNVLGKCTDFECAVKKLWHTNLVAPTYFTVSGMKHGEGVLIERSRVKVDSCYALAGFNIKGLKCKDAEHAWFLAVSNWDAKEESAGGLAFSRRNMAQHAMNSASQICSKQSQGSAAANCRVSETVLEKVLRWGFVTQTTTVYRSFMEPSAGSMKTTVVKDKFCNWENRYCKAAKTIQSFLSGIENIALKQGKGLVGFPNALKLTCPSGAKAKVMDCSQTWAEDARRLAENYMGRAMLGRFGASRLHWTFQHFLSCSCQEPL